MTLIRRIAKSAKSHIHQEFLCFVFHPPSPDNSAGHSISCWVKPTSLPAHGSKDRHFILESTAEGKPSRRSAYHLSLELSPADHREEIAVRLHTITLKPGGSQKAPTSQSQGPFQTSHPRAQIENRWSHLLVSFDSQKLTVYLNGKLAGSHSLEVPGPASEFGGLIIGGHRAGTGRNFDGLIDEVTAWQAVIGAAQATELFDRGRGGR